MFPIPIDGTIMRVFWHSVKWLATLALVGGILTGAYFINAGRQSERDRETGETKKKSPSSTKEDDGRGTGATVSLAADAAERLGLKVEPAVSVEWIEQVAVYGQVIPNPRATTEIRVPFAGVLRAEGTAWPRLGERVRSGQTLGWLAVRIPPQERLTLNDNLNTARLKQKGAAEVVRIQQDRVTRLEQIAKSEIGSQQQVDDARVLLAQAKTELAMAAAAGQLWQQALHDAESPDGAKPSIYRLRLIAPADGEVTGAARPPE